MHRAAAHILPDYSLSLVSRLDPGRLVKGFWRDVDSSSPSGICQCSHAHLPIDCTTSSTLPTLICATAHVFVCVCAVAQSYMMIFPPLLNPMFWERPGNIPALTRLLVAYLSKAGQQIVAGGARSVGVRAHSHTAVLLLLLSRVWGLPCSCWSSGLL